MLAIIFTSITTDDLKYTYRCDSHYSFHRARHVQSEASIYAVPDPLPVELKEDANKNIYNGDDVVKLICSATIGLTINRTVWASWSFDYSTQDSQT